MKLYQALILLLSILFLLVGCNSSDNHTFIGTIEEINEQQALVHIEEGVILQSGDKVYVDLSVAEESTIQVGDKIEVEYDGEIRESFPLGINTQRVTLLN